MKKVILTLFSLSIIAVSCKKEDKDCPKTQAEIAGTYKYEKLEISSGGTFNNVTDLLLEPCQKDDQLVLNANGTANYNDVGVTCTPNGSDNSTWSVNGDGTISIDENTIDFENAKIVSFDCNTLVLEQTESFGGATTTYRITLKK